MDGLVFKELWFVLLFSGNNKWYEEYTGKLKSLFDKLLVYNSLYISSQEQRDSEILSHEGKLFFQNLKPPPWLRG